MSRSALPVVGPNGEVHIPLPRRARGVDDDATILMEVARVEPISETPRRLEVWLRQVCWAAPAIVTLVSCLIGISGPALWADELATWGITTVSWPELWKQLDGTDASIGPYYVFIRLWTTVFGDSDLALRLPSTFAMVATAAVIGLVGRRLGTPRAGLIAGLVFAVLPITARFGQEARPYALATFAAAVATLLLIRMLEGYTLGVGLAYALSLTVLGALHLVALSLLAGHGLAVLVHKRKLLWRWVPTAVGGLVPLIPLVLIGRRQQGNQIGWIPLADLHQLEAYANEMFGSAVVGGALLVLGAAALSRERGAVVAACVAVTPAAALFTVGTVAHLWQQRYVLFTVVGWALLAGLLLAKRGVVAAAAAVTTLAVLSLPGQVSVRKPAFRYQDTAAVVALLTSTYRPGDGIVYGLQDRGPGVLNRDIVAHYIPADMRPTDLLVDRPMRTDGWMVASEYQDVAARLGETPRVWVLRLGEYGDPLDGLDGSKSQALGERYDVQETWRTTGYTVALLIRKATE
jgi:mannosyltransferase